MTAPHLSPRQRRILWHRAQGLSAAQTARAEGISTGTESYHEQVIMTRLRARSITHAVHLAHVAGLIGTYPDCGDRAAYLRHLRRRDPTCTACRAANARNAQAQRDATQQPSAATASARPAPSMSAGRAP